MSFFIFYYIHCTTWRKDMHCQRHLLLGSALDGMSVEWFVFKSEIKAVRFSLIKKGLHRHYNIYILYAWKSTRNHDFLVSAKAAWTAINNPPFWVLLHCQIDRSIQINKDQTLEFGSYIGSGILPKVVAKSTFITTFRLSYDDDEWLAK